MRRARVSEVVVEEKKRFGKTRFFSSAFVGGRSSCRIKEDFEDAWRDFLCVKTMCKMTNVTAK